MVFVIYFESIDIVDVWDVTTLFDWRVEEVIGCFVWSLVWDVRV